jgi:hypothetical protein
MMGYLLQPLAERSFHVATTIREMDVALSNLALDHFGQAVDHPFGQAVPTLDEGEDSEWEFNMCTSCAII